MTDELPPPAPTSRETLIEWRAAMKLSQRAAARALGCSPTALGNWEIGATDPPPYIVLAMTALSRGLPPYLPGDRVTRRRPAPAQPGA